MNNNDYIDNINKQKINRYKVLTNIVNKNTLEFQNKYPFLWNLFENNIRATLDDSRKTKHIIKTPSFFKLTISYLYQLYYFYMSKFFYNNKNNNIILAISNFHSLQNKFKNYLENNSYSVLSRISLSIMSVFNSKNIFFTALGLPICNYRGLNNLFESKKFLLVDFDLNEINFLNKSELIIKKHILKLSRIYKMRNVKAILSTGSSSFSSSSLCLAAKISGINYTILAHGYISNPELITIAPVRSNFLIVWTKYQVKMLKEKIKNDEKDKVLYLGYPGERIIREVKKPTKKILFALEPIQKLIEMDTDILKNIRYLSKKLKGKFDLVFRPHPKDSKNYNKIKNILHIETNMISNNSLKNDLSTVDAVIATNSSVLIHANLSGIYSYQIQEGAKSIYDGIPCYDIKSLIDTLDKILNEEKKPIIVDYLEDNLDSLKNILLSK